MLKIKDNVDLKELEKFGFEFERGTTFTKTIGESYITTSDCDLRKISIYIEDWEIEDNRNEIFNTLYDLIKADLVEKIEEE